MAIVQVNDSLNQQLVKVNPDDVIELQLDESPATSYKWEITGIDNSALELISADFALHKDAAIGGGGIKTFRLKVLKPGGQLKLENRQSWSGDVYKTFQVSF